VSPKRLATRRFWVRHRGAVSYLMLVIVVFYLYHSQQQTAADTRSTAAKAARSARLGVKTHTGVCRLKDDLENRIAKSEAFLVAHPNGIPGFSAAAIQSSINGQRRTIRSLRVIGPCPP
jgi:hypothetical protein